MILTDLVAHKLSIRLANRFFSTMMYFNDVLVSFNNFLLQIKLGSVKLAKRYMKRVAMELQAKSALEKDPAMDYMLLQGVRFAFRIHQVCP